MQSSPEQSEETPDSQGTNVKSHYSNFKSSPVQTGSSPDDPGSMPPPVSSGSGEAKSSPSSDEGGRTASLSGDAIVDDMVMEALAYAQDAKESSGHTAATTGNIPSFHSVRTSQSGGG